MNKFKKYLFYTTCPISFILVLILAIAEESSHFCLEGFHHFEAWCFNYKDSGLIYRGDGIWSSPRKGDEGYE